jgi:hypothetical protein
MRLTLPDGSIAYDPRGRVDAPRIAPAPRLERIDGARLAVLDNSKWNASRLLRATVEALGGEARFASVRHWKKDSFSRDAPPEMVREIAASSDLALVAIGD